MRRQGCIWSIFVILIGGLILVACGSSKVVEGSERTYYGIVTDCGMSVINEGDREGYPYIIIETTEGPEVCFWIKDKFLYSAGIGSTVTIESAIEEGTNLLVATKVSKHESYFNFSKEDFKVVEEEENHGGFHGDGTYHLILDCTENKEKALENVKGWNKLPLSKNLKLIMYGDESGQYGYDLAEEVNIPEVTNGYYYFCDRHSDSTDSSDDTNLLSRASFNFTLAIYDSDTNRLYYVEFDT